MRVRVLLFSVLGAFGIAAAPAVAAPCAGFTDVDTSSSFCPNVEWLKNRGVTLGCTSTTLYCPGDLVTRLSMAAFMNRLATALTPTVIYQGETMPTTIGAAYVYACQTPDFTVTHPQTATLVGSATFAVAGNPLTTRIRLAYSVDGGANWSNAAGGYLWLASAAAGEWASATGHGMGIDLVPGTNYRFGIGVQILAGTGTYNEVGCRTTLTLTNRNGTSPPYDADPASIGSMAHD